MTRARLRAFKCRQGVHRFKMNRLPKFRCEWRCKDCRRAMKFVQIDLPVLVMRPDFAIRVQQEAP